VSKVDDIIQNGVLKKKVQLPRTVISHSGFIFPLEQKICYLVYNLNGEIAYKEVSKEQYNKIKI